MIEKTKFGVINEEDIFLFTISNKNNLSVEVCEFGCTVVSIKTPDRDGKFDDIVLGYNSLQDYQQDSYYIGTVVGRCANRIKNASFILNGNLIHLSANEGANHLHGGFEGFGKKVWKGMKISDSCVAFFRISPDGEEGYPGNLSTTILYTLTDKNEFIIEYISASDADTIVNFSNHSYFNLTGQSSNTTIEDHFVEIRADFFSEIDGECSSTGAILSVGNGPFDLRIPQQIGGLMISDEKQMVLGSGFNHNFVMSGDRQYSAKVFDKKSGRCMIVFTDRPGIHFYAGNYLNDKIIAKKSEKYQRFAGLCLETQCFPNAINIPHFPSPLLKKDELYRSRTIYKFSVESELE